MTNIPDAPSIAFVDDPHAPDIFADAVRGWYSQNGNIRITLTSFRVSHISSPGPVNEVVIGRLVMSVDQAEAMAKGLLEFIQRQRALKLPTSQGSQAIN